VLGPIHLVAGSASTLLASLPVARRVAEDPRYVSRLLGWVFALSRVPSILLYCVESKTAAVLLLWIFVPSLYFFIEPTFGLLQIVVPAQMRATSCAIYIFISNLANLVIALQLIGWMSDRFASTFAAGQESLRWALVLLAPTGLWAAWHLWTSGVTIREDEARMNRQPISVGND
jgi:hypothetical protein